MKEDNKYYYIYHKFNYLTELHIMYYIRKIYILHIDNRNILELIANTVCQDYTNFREW